MPTPTGVFTFGIAAAIALLAARWARASSKKPTGPTVPLGPDCDPKPYTWDQQMVINSIESELVGGETDPATISVNVADELFGAHPSGASVMFPPGASALPGVQCVWIRITNLVNQIITELPQPVVFVNHGAFDPGYPWPEPTIHKGADGKHSPVPGTLYLVGAMNADPPVNNLATLTKNVLGNAIAMANQMAEGPNSLDPKKAGSQDTPYKDLRMQVIKYLLNPWNWKLFAQTNANLAGGVDPGKGGVGCDDGNIRDVNATPTTYMMCGGKGLNWCPRHANNIQLLQQGQKPKRTTTQDGKKIGTYATQMQLWIPAFDLAGLRQAVPVIRTLKNPHPGWTDTIVPPPAVWNKGVDGGIPGACPGIPTA
jgi:hypothetical protein